MGITEALLVSEYKAIQERRKVENWLEELIANRDKHIYTEENKGGKQGISQKILERT